jgi:hypothetical protein
VTEHVRRFLDGTRMSIKGLDRDEVPPSTASEIFIGPSGAASEFVRMTADAATDVAPTFGYEPTDEVVLTNGLTVRYGFPYGDPVNGIGFSISVGDSQSTISSWVPQELGAAGLLQWLAGFTWSFDGEDLNVLPPDAAARATRWRPRVYQVVPGAGMLTMELAGPALSPPKGTGMRVPGGLLYRRSVQGQVAQLILDGGDILTKMMPFPEEAVAPEDLIAEASQLVVHRV